MVTTNKLLKQLSTYNYSSDAYNTLHFSRWKGFYVARKMEMTAKEAVRMHQALEKLAKIYNNPKLCHKKLSRIDGSKIEYLEANIEIFKKNIQLRQSDTQPKPAKGLAKLWRLVFKSSSEKLSALNANDIQLNPSKPTAAPASRQSAVTVKYSTSEDFAWSVLYDVTPNQPGEHYINLFNDATDQFGRNNTVVECKDASDVTKHLDGNYNVSPGGLKLFIILSENSTVPQLLVIYGSNRWNVDSEEFWFCNNISKSKDGFQFRCLDREDKDFECRSFVSLKLGIERAK